VMEPEAYQPVLLRRHPKANPPAPLTRTIQGSMLAPNLRMSAPWNNSGAKKAKPTAPMTINSSAKRKALIIKLIRSVNDN